MELVICVRDHGPCKAGTVIVACPDGWRWSQKEKDNPDWKIVSTPVAPIEARAWASDWKRFSVNVAHSDFKEKMKAKRFRALVTDKGAAS